MRGKIVSVVLTLVFTLGFSMTALAEAYDHEAEIRGMTFSWKVAGESVHIKLSGRTTGWIGIGFNPVEQMKGANYILGYVRGGKVELTDDYGYDERNHKSDEKLGGTTDVTLVGGEEKGGMTTIEFTIPLNSGDKYDSVLDPNGETVVLLAFGGKRDSFRSKHKYREVLTVNLSTGETK